MAFTPGLAAYADAGRRKGRTLPLDRVSTGRRRSRHAVPIPHEGRADVARGRLGTFFQCRPGVRAHSPAHERARDPASHGGPVKLTSVDYLCGSSVVILISFLDYGRDSPTMSYCKAFFEYGAMMYPRSSDVLATRSATGWGRSMRETPAGRLVADFGAVVHACSRFDENVLYLSEPGNISLRRRITAQLVDTDPARHRV